jgi:hypothetical protein
MGEAGRERARRYDWPVVAAEVEQVYMNAIDAGRPSRRKRR